MFTDLTLARALSSSFQELILLPTEKCNFRCTYCYEDFVVGRMRPEVIAGVRAFIFNRVPELKQLTLSWFGGEPLLATSIVKDIGGYAFSLCEEIGVDFQAGMTTNGYLLTRDLFEELVAIGHRSYQITLDGDAQWHDQTRIQANRRPTFERIWSQLLSYRQVGGPFQVTLRLHVHRDNVESVRRLYADIKQSFGEDSRFTTYFHKISPLGGEHQAQLMERALSNAEYADALAFIRGDESPVQPGRSELELEGYICYAARPNSLMVRANGRIGKCTVALNDPRNDIGRLNPDGTLDISNPKLRRWLMGYADLSEKTLGCPLSTLHQYEAEVA